MLAVDSSWAPTDAQVAAARAAGVDAWLGYFKSGPDNILNGWTDQDFETVQAGGLETAAFASGWADPADAGARAARLGIRGILDVEGSIRDDGPWVDPWLRASGFALYGGATVMRAHLGHGHPGYLVSDYIGQDQGQTWLSFLPPPNPPRPTGRQFAGDVRALPYTPVGFAVDQSRLDPQLLATQGDLEMFVRRSTDGAIALASPFLHLSGPQWASVVAAHAPGSPVLVDDDSLFSALEAAASSPAPAPGPTTLAITGGSLRLG